MSTDLAVTLESVNKKFRVYNDRPKSLKQLLSGTARLAYDEVWVLRDVSLEVGQGSTLGIVGHNGSGKSTLLRVMAGIYKPTSGAIAASGRVASLMELGAGFHPELSGRDNVFLNGALMGLTRGQVRKRFDEIVDFAEVGDFIDAPVKHYSSGMYVRLGFAVAVNLDADIILIDEVIAVGDAEFQQRCKDHIRGLAKSGRTVVVVSHVLADIKDLSDEVVWLDHGKVMAAGDPEEITNDYVKAARQHMHQLHDVHKPVAIESITLLDASGTGVTGGITGRPLTLRVSFHAATPLDEPIFRLTVDHVTGTPIFGTNTTMEPLNVGRIEGRGYVDYRIDSLPLVPGSYLVSAWMYDRTFSQIHDAMERALLLDVAPGSSPSRYGVVESEGRWTLNG